MEIERLVSIGVFKPITHSEWAVPLVPILKADKQSIRFCGDYMAIINMAAKVDHYPMPKTEDIFAKLADKKLFVKLDMSDAYTQLILDESSQHSIGTHGYHSLSIWSIWGAGHFQRRLEELLRPVSQVSVYIDDVIIGGEDEADLLQALEDILILFEDAGLRLNREKCQFLLTSVAYLGHEVNKDGIHLTAIFIATNLVYSAVKMAYGILRQCLINRLQTVWRNEPYRL